MDETDDLRHDAPERGGGTDFEPDQVLDVKGLSCPMPVLRAKMALGRMQPGERLRVLATDPYSVSDFEAFCAKTGHVLIAHRQQDRVFIFDVQC